MMGRFDEQLHIQENISRVISELHAVDGFPWEVLSELSGYSVSHLKQVSYNDKPFVDLAKFMQLARNLSRQKNNRLIKLMLSPQFEIVQREGALSDGNIDDEIADFAVAMGGMKTAHKNRKKAEMSAQIDQMENVIARAKAERDRL